MATRPTGFPKTSSPVRHDGKIQTTGPLSALLCGILLLSGCATFTPKPEASWTVHGRLAGQHYNEGFSAHFFYAQTGKDFELQLLGPLGMHPIRITQKPQEITAYFDGKVYHAKNADILTYHLTGWDLPIHFLPHWLKGTPAPTPKVHNLQKDKQGNITYFMQDNWEVSLDYKNQGLHKIVISNDPWRFKVLLRH